MGSSIQGCAWQGLCESFFVRTEAERIILGPENSPSLTADSFATAYRKQKSIIQLLSMADDLASERKWTQSAAAYAAALRDPDFHWNEECRTGVYSCLGIQMGTAFVKAGEPADYEWLCRVVLDNRSTNSTTMEAVRLAHLCFLNGATLPQDLQQRGLEVARFAAAYSDKSSYWRCFSSGMAEFHAGDPERAIKLLTVSEGSKDIYCKGGAMVCRAMALKKLGRDAEAAEVLRAAETLLAAPLKSRSGGSWWDMEISQLTLEKARALIKQPSEP